MGSRNRMSVARPCCMTCPGCSGGVPRELEVEISGVVHASSCVSGDCDQYNGIFSLPWSGTLTNVATVDGLATRCVWEDWFDIATPCSCGHIYDHDGLVLVEAWMDFAPAYGGIYKLYVFQRCARGDAFPYPAGAWRKEFGSSQPDCAAWSSESLPRWFPSNTSCNWGASSCLVTAVS